MSAPSTISAKAPSFVARTGIWSRPPVDWPLSAADWFNAETRRRFNVPEPCKHGDNCYYQRTKKVDDSDSEDEGEKEVCKYVHPGEEGMGLKYYPARGQKGSEGGKQTWEQQSAIVRLHPAAPYIDRRRQNLPWNIYRMRLFGSSAHCAAPAAKPYQRNSYSHPKGPIDRRGPSQVSLGQYVDARISPSGERGSAKGPPRPARLISAAAGGGGTSARLKNVSSKKHEPTTPPYHPHTPPAAEEDFIRRLLADPRVKAIGSAMAKDMISDIKKEVAGEKTSPQATAYFWDSLEGCAKKETVSIKPVLVLPEEVAASASASASASAEAEELAEAKKAEAEKKQSVAEKIAAMKAAAAAKKAAKAEIVEEDE